MPQHPDIADILPWRYGPAQCLQCAHSWVAVWPLGCPSFECPSCGSTDTVCDAVDSFANERQYAWRLTC